MPGKESGEDELELHVFDPEGHKAGDAAFDLTHPHVLRSLVADAAHLVALARLGLRDENVKQFLII